MSESFKAWFTNVLAVVVVALYAMGGMKSLEQYHALIEDILAGIAVAGLLLARDPDAFKKLMNRKTPEA